MNLGPETQTVLALLLVAAALLWLGRQAWRKLAAKDAKACGSGCGCAAKGARPPALTKARPHLPAGRS